MRRRWWSVLSTLALLALPCSSQQVKGLESLKASRSQLTGAARQVDVLAAHASQEIQARINAIPAPAPINEGSTQIALASAEHRNVLIDQVKSFANDAAKEEGRYSALAIGSLVLAAGLALIGSIASFLSKNKIAGVISLIVASIVGFSNAYPLGPLADFYRALHAQANALVADCTLTEPYTTTAYASDVTQYK